MDALLYSETHSLTLSATWIGDNEQCSKILRLRSPKVPHGVDDNDVERPRAILREESFRLLPALPNAGDAIQVSLLWQGKVLLG